MRWSEIDFKPSSRKVRQFALLWLLFFGLLAVSSADQGHWWACLGVASAAIVGALTGLLKPALLRPIYTGWMVLVFPVSWVVSHLMLALLFFGVFTPLALLLKLTGRDALQRRIQPGSKTYWVPLPMSTDVRRSFRPF